MRKGFIFLMFLFLLLGTNAFATGLLVETGDIWTYNGNTYQPYQAMDDLGISYDKIEHADFNYTNLDNYDFIYLVGSDGNTGSFDSYVDMNKVSNFVNGGGLAIIHYADWSGDRTDVGPSGVNVGGYYSEIGNIVSGKESDPLFENLTDNDLDNWNYTSHGYLENLPSTSEILITDNQNRPIYARYQMGNGEVWISTMTMEWGEANHNLMLNELKLANQYQYGNQPVPEPTTILLMGIGFLTIAGYGRKKFLRMA